MAQSRRMPHTPRAKPPLDAGSLERLALRYVERFATSRGKLAAYLDRKIRERGWSGDAGPDPADIAERMAARGYVDDRLFAEARVRSMARRGLGARRVSMALRQDGIASDDAEDLAEAIEADAVASAITFARRRRLGPYAAEPADRELKHKQLSAFLRAGHSPQIALRILNMLPGEDPARLLEAGQA
ncbi:RecX family transcriptional regulator [Sphingomonas sp. WG]|nr:RecX family transcriptional regulator [Sphingomonas sp. WG]